MDLMMAGESLIQCRKCGDRGRVIQVWINGVAVFMCVTCLVGGGKQ
jgi:hypothetical protein